MVGYKRRRLDAYNTFLSTALERFTHTPTSKMKMVILAVALALVLASGEALDCLRCVPTKAGRDCVVTVETCPPEKDGCAAAKFLRAPFGHFQRCMDMSGCKQFQTNAYINMKCCDTEKCNTF